MSGRGYDARAIKMPKPVKRWAARIHDNHQRGEFFRQWTKILEADLRGSKRGGKEQQ